MATKRPIVSTEAIDLDPISDWEVDQALRYADQRYVEELDPDLFRIVFHTVQKRRVPGMILPLLVATVCREMIRESENKYQAFKGAVMKVFNHRKQVKERADIRKRQRGLPVTEPVPQTLHPFDPNDPQQLLLR